MPCDCESLVLNEFWLYESGLERLRLLLPQEVPGVARVDGRRVIKGSLVESAIRCVTL